MFDTSEIVLLSSDEEEKEEEEAVKEGTMKKKRKTIEGIPKSFEGDRKKRFSFGVSEEKDTIEMAEVQESPKPNSRMSIQMKTPTSACRRRRSISVTCLTSEKRKINNEPPRHRICSTFVEKIDEIPLSSSSSSLSSSSSSSSPSESDDEQTMNKVEEERSLKALLSPKKTMQKQRKEKIKEVQNEFFGVYCLISRSDRPCYKNRCYIGYTVDPNRRIMQHNGGRMKGGAKKTDSRGPWEMVCVIHGFPNHVAALRFEWAWQNPTMSKAIRDRQLKKERKETPFAYQLRIACNLMNSQPFSRFALTFCWLTTTNQIDFPKNTPPPDHIKLKYGKVKKNMSQVPKRRDDFVKIEKCRLCEKQIEKIWHMVRCIGDNCQSIFHTKCLAENSLKKSEEIEQQIFPLQGNCPTCSHSYLWGDVIREQRRILKVATKSDEEMRNENFVVRKGLPHREISPVN